MSFRSARRAHKDKARGQGTDTSASDSRFAALSTDPRFRLPSKKHSRVKLDQRLSSILQDDSFSRKASVDRYGRKTSTIQGRKDLERLYRLGPDASDPKDDKDNEDAAIQAELERIDQKYDPARDGGFSTSDSESDSDSNAAVDDDHDGHDILLEAALPDLPDGVPMGDVSSRLAVVNLDWDHISAQDILSVAASFVPLDGSVLSVAVYPSEFGRERMEKEELHGPPKEIFQSIAGTSDHDVSSEPSSSLDHDDEDTEIKESLVKEDTGAEFDSAALRKYQLDRLRYYYAVISCSSPAVAQSLYQHMDGQEYLHSANFFDLRFVPDQVDFDSDKPRDFCRKVPAGYRPTEFTTDALMHSNVKLTWDADDPKRKEVQKRAFSRKEIDENDLLAYIGSASSSEDSEVDESNDLDADSVAGSEPDVASRTSKATTRQHRRDALRAALGLTSEYIGKTDGNTRTQPVGDMQITFTPALATSSSIVGQSVFQNAPLPVEETTTEKYIRKERERKSQRKARSKEQRGVKTNTVSSSQTEAMVPQGLGTGFDDPFFANPDAVITSSRNARKMEALERKRQAKNNSRYQSEEDIKNSDLQLIMMDDQTESNGTRFDMKAIAKREKASQKPHKKHKSSGKSTPVGASPLDSFEMNVSDGRFEKLFNDPAFAIDPTDAKYRDTEGIRSLLTEKRRRDGDQEGASRQTKRRQNTKPDRESIHDAISRIQGRDVAFTGK